MNDERIQSVLEEWFVARDTAPNDVPRSARRVAERRPQVRQRSRWWPFPVFYRRTETTTATDTTEYQSNLIPATNGHAPSAIGRTYSMFSPVKAITAGALVFAIGGAFLIAQPFEQQANVPQAEAETMAPTWVTGNVAYSPSCQRPNTELEGVVTRRLGFECSPQRWTSSDPRLTGEVSYRWNEDAYVLDEGPFSVNTAAAYVRSDDGGWACSSSVLLEGFGLAANAVTGETLTCVGEDGYEGLSALIVLDEGDASHPLVGLIFPGGFPPLPEPPGAD